MWRTGMGALVSFTKGNDDVLPMVILHKQHALHEHEGPDSCNLGSLFPVLPGAKGANKQSSHCMQMQLCKQLYVCLSVLALQYCLSLLTHELPQKYSRKARVENGKGKSRPDRLCLPFKPTVNRFREKNGKMGKQNGKTGGNGNGNGWGVFPTVFTVPVFSRENSRGNSRICRSRLCYLCWKRELLFACVPT